MNVELARLENEYQRGKIDGVREERERILRALLSMKNTYCREYSKTAYKRAVKDFKAIIESGKSE